jgi:predicted PurR-regulated permease PerM
MSTEQRPREPQDAGADDAEAPEAQAPEAKDASSSQADAKDVASSQADAKDVASSEADATDASSSEADGKDAQPPESEGPTSGNLGMPLEFGPPVDREELAVAPRVLVPRWVQLVVLPLMIVAGYELMRAAKSVILLFTVAAIIALILNPLVHLLQRARLPRGLAVLGVYLAFFVTLAGIGVLLSIPISDQINTFIKDLPTLVKHANKSLDSLQNTLAKSGIHIQLQKQGHTALQTLQDKLLKASSSIASFGGNLLTKVAGIAFDVVLVFVLSVYFLLYGERIGALVRRIMPPSNGQKGDDYPTRIQGAVSSYVRGQLLFSLIMGTTGGFALFIFGVIGIFPDGRTYAVAFGAFLGVMELIPYVGPVLGAVPPILVALFSDPLSAVWVAVLFVALQQLEGHVVSPQIFSHSLRINPLLIIFALLFGTAIYGLVGALIALPIASVVRETAIYLDTHLELESWKRAGPLL